MQPKNDRLVQRVFLALMLSTGLCAHFTLDAAASADKKPTTTTNKSSTQSSPKKSSPKVSAPKVRSQSKQQAKSRAKHTTPNRSRTASRTMPTTKTPTRTYTPSLVVPTRLPTPTPTIILKPRPTITFPVTPARKNELDAILTRIGTRTKPTSDPPLLPKPDPEATATELPRTIPLGTEIPPNDSDDGDQGSRGGGNGCWTQCCNDGFNFWFNYGSPFWGGFGWGFGYVNDCGWWWWAGDGFCSPWWRSPWNSYCWWYPSPYWGWNQGWWNYTTVLVQQPVVVYQQQALPGTTSWAQTTAALPTPAPPQGEAIVLERPDGSIVIASPSQAWLYLGYGETTLAAEIFAAFLQESPNATEYLLGYTLALACTGSDETRLAALVLEEVLRLDAGVLLSVPLDLALHERLGELKLKLLLMGRGVEIDSGSLLLLAAVRTILGEETSALAALRVAEELFGPTPGSQALRRLLEQLRDTDLISMR